MCVAKMILYTTAGALLAILLSPVVATSGQTGGGRDSPVICIPTNDVFRIDTVLAFPGQDTVKVPVYFQPQGGHQAREFEFEVPYPSNGLQYIGYDTLGIAWAGSRLNIHAGTSTVEVQGVGDTVSGPSAKLVNLLFGVADPVGFDSTMNLSLQPDTWFKIVGSELNYDPVTVGGWIRTRHDSAYVSVVSDTGYSYQALDQSSSFKDTIFVKIPVNLFTSFRTTAYEFYLKFAPSPHVDSFSLEFAGYDSAAAGYNATAATYDGNYVRVRNSAPTAIPGGTAGCLITLWFRVKDFHTQYNLNPAFDKVIPIAASTAHQSYLTYGNYGSSHRVDLIPGSNFHGGQVYLPKYMVEFDLNYVTVPSTRHVQFPVKLKPTFWSQFYDLTIVYDEFSRGYLQFDSIKAGPGAVPQSVTWDDNGELVQAVTEVPALQDDEYVLPNAYAEIFTIHFTATEEFMQHPGETVPIFIRSSQENVVKDYFPPEESGFHVIRSGNLGRPYFDPDTGYVHLPFALVNADDSVSCDHDNAWVPIRVDWIGENEFKEVRVYASTPGPLYFDNWRDGEFSATWYEVHVEPEVFVALGKIDGSVQGPGVLLEVHLRGDPTYDPTPVQLDSVVFYNPRLAAAVEDGWITACKSRGSDGIVIPTMPVSPLLAQNHPNPFNARTIIEFKLRQGGRTTLDIYDVLGRKVKRLLSTELAVGQHEVLWDGTNDDNSEVSSGTYIYILRVDDYVKSKRMLLIK